MPSGHYVTASGARYDVRAVGATNVTVRSLDDAFCVDLSKVVQSTGDQGADRWVAELGVARLRGHRCAGSAAADGAWEARFSTKAAGRLILYPPNTFKAEGQTPIELAFDPAGARG